MTLFFRLDFMIALLLHVHRHFAQDLEELENLGNICNKGMQVKIKVWLYKKFAFACFACISRPL